MLGEDFRTELRWSAAAVLAGVLTLVISVDQGWIDVERTDVNSGLFFFGLMVMGVGVYALFRLSPALGWGDRGLLIATSAGGLVMFLMADGVPGFEGRGLYLSVPAVVSLVLGFLGKRQRE